MPRSGKKKCLFGVEQEFALSVKLADTHKIMDNPQAMQAFLNMVTERNPHLPRIGGLGIHLQSGALAYPDRDRLEFSSAECSTLSDLFSNLISGQLIFAEAASTLRAEPHISQVTLHNSAVDYHGWTSAGTHYCHYYKHPFDSKMLTPHFLALVPLCGSGGFVGLRYGFSARVPFINAHVASTTGPVRPIIDCYKKKPLSTSGYRVQDLTADGNRSMTNVAIRAGSNAIVLRLLEHGHIDLTDLQPRDPVSALHIANVDDSLDCPLELVTGKRITIIEIGKEIHRRVEKRLDGAELPEWAPSFVARWGELLDALDMQDEHLCLTLDWAIKRELLRELAAQKGVRWNLLSFWDAIHQRLKAAMGAGKDRTILTPDVLSSRSLAWPLLKRLAPRLHEHGCTWDAFAHVLECMPAFHEMATIYHDLSEYSLFHVIEPELGHHWPGVTSDTIESARSTPPQDTRARLRGEFVANYAGRPGYACSWQQLQKPDAVARIANPFQNSVHWKTTRSTKPHLAYENAGRQEALVVDALSLYDQGSYDAAFCHLQEYSAQVQYLRRSPKYWRYLAWIQCRRGHSDEAIKALHKIDGRSPADFFGINQRLLVYRHAGLRGCSASNHWINLGRRLLDQSQDFPDYLAHFHGHVAYLAYKRGRLKEALAAGVQAESYRTHSKARTAILLTLGEIYRLLDDSRRAFETLNEAESLAQEHDYFGDLASILLAKAKLSTQCNVHHALSHAQDIFERNKDAIGFVRCLLVITRLGVDGTRNEYARIVKTRQSVPAIAKCRHLTKILSRWPDFSQGKSMAKNCVDDFWFV